MKDVIVKSPSGEEVTVSFVSFEEMEDLYGKGSALPLLSACGFATMYVTAAHLEAAKEHFKDAAAQGAIAAARAGHHITILSDVKDKMTQEDVEAVFWHEMGHVHHGHVRTITESMDSSKVRIEEGATLLRSEEAEIEADEFAAKMVGYRSLLKAIGAVVKAQAEVVEELSRGKRKADEVYRVINDALVASERYQILIAKAAAEVAE